MHGTVHTRTGMSFTGYVTWDVDEIYSTDILDGDHDGDRLRIPFGQIASIEQLLDDMGMLPIGSRRRTFAADIQGNDGQAFRHLRPRRLETRHHPPK